MSHKRIAIGFIFMLQAIAAMAWSGYNVKATEAMDQGDYVQAARYWRQHTQEIEEALSENQEPDPLELQGLFYAISSEINCLYMLDDYLGMQELSKKFDSLAEKHLYNYKDEDLYLDAAARSMKNWASVYYLSTDTDASMYRFAEDLYQRCLENADPTDTEFISTVHLEMAQLYYKWASVGNALSYYTKALENLEESRIDSPLIQSQKAITKARIGSVVPDDDEARKYLSEAVADIDKAMKQVKSNTDEYTEMERKKGKILMLQEQRTGTDNYSKARKSYQKYIDREKAKVTRDFRTLTPSQQRQAWIRLHPFMYDCCLLGDRGADMIYDMALYTKGYLIRPQGTKVPDWKKIASKLKADEVAIEYVVHDGDLKACIVEKGCKKPQLIRVCNIDSLLDTEIGWWDNVREAITLEDARLKNYLYTDSVVQATIWPPEIMQKLQGKKSVYFSPDGLLHQLAIEYMIPDSTITAYRLSSTARLLDRKPRSYRNLLICGGVDYDDMDNAEGVQSNDLEAYRYLEGKISRLNYLPGSLLEADSIYHRRGCKTDTLLLGEHATESRIRMLAPQYDIVHLCTHGYFEPEEYAGTDLKSSISDNALSHTGLIFAGATVNLNSEDFDPTLTDGILSAAEIAESDWSRVGLVVLSACQTAQGYITDDGLYGMQRGIKMSGADAMIVSLWSVNDASTYLMMKYFYEELEKTPESAHKAFTNARRRLCEGEVDDVTRFSAARLARTTSDDLHSEKFQKPSFTHPFIAIDLW